MSRFKFSQIIRNYRKLESHIYYLVGLSLCLELINTSFFLLFNYYMEKEGYADYEIARVIAFRFFIVMLLATPLGFFIRGKRLKPFFMIAAVSVPIFSLIVIYAVAQHLNSLLYISVQLWGAGFAFLQVASLPYILLNTPKAQQSEAISIFYQTWSFGVFFTGIMYYLFNQLNPEFFTERLMLQVFVVLGFGAIWFVSRIRIIEKRSEPILVRSFQKVSDGWHIVKEIIAPYDWKLIFNAVIPTLIIAIGAGFTIPVINLFFLNIHGVDSGVFSLLGATTYALVTLGVTFIPAIRRQYGYKVAITLFQSLAIFALFVMATTEYYAYLSWAVYVAIFFYIIRQPLMSIAKPMTSELAMYYVGPRNQEMVSALTASIWSGSWFISTYLFSIMRESGMRYVSIFLITVVLYIIGVVWYTVLIRSYERNLANKKS